MRFNKLLPFKKRNRFLNLHKLSEMKEHILVKNAKTKEVYAIRSSIDEYNTYEAEALLTCIDIKGGKLNAQKCFYFSKEELLTI